MITVMVFTPLFEIKDPMSNHNKLKPQPYHPIATKILCPILQGTSRRTATA